jgi:hypothetical protein
MTPHIISEEYRATAEDVARLSAARITLRRVIGPNACIYAVSLDRVQLEQARFTYDELWEADDPVAYICRRAVPVPTLFDDDVVE